VFNFLVKLGLAGIGLWVLFEVILPLCFIALGLLISMFVPSKPPPKRNRGE
jgi:hypothetical protein